MKKNWYYRDTWYYEDYAIISLQMYFLIEF